MIINFKKKRFNLDVENCSIFKKFLGLMFSQRENAKILLFEFDRKQKIAIHSFFVFYDFLALWLDESNNIIDLKIVRPFTLCVFSKKNANKLIEIPISKKYKKILKNLITDEGLERFKYNNH